MEPLTAEEKKEFQEILSHMYGKQAYTWNINIKVLKLLEELLRKSEACSRYMDMVPRPFYVGNALRWTSRQARHAVVRHLKNGGKHYELPPLMWIPLLTRRGGKCQNTTSQEKPGNIQKTSKLKR